MLASIVSSPLPSFLSLAILTESLEVGLGNGLVENSVYQNPVSQSDSYVSLQYQTLPSLDFVWRESETKDPSVLRTKTS